MIVLGLAGFAGGSLAFDSLARMGGWERVIGFAVALLYFGILNSAIGGGRTVGKRVLGLRVVSGAGNPLGLGRSLVRFSVMGVPYFLNNAPIALDASNLWLAGLLTFLIFGWGLSIVYLAIFNRRTRQSLHDLAVGSYVVRNGVAAPAGTQPWRGHLVVVSLILLITLVAPVPLSHLAQGPSFAPLLSLQQALMRNDDVRYATVNQGYTKSFNNGTTTRYLDIRVRLVRRVPDDAALARRLAGTVLDQDPESATLDLIGITTTYGFDMGIASAWRSSTQKASPQDWRKPAAAPN